MERVQIKQLLNRRRGCWEIPSEPSATYILNTLESGLLLDCGDTKIIKSCFCSRRAYDLVEGGKTCKGMNGAKVY